MGYCSFCRMEYPGNSSTCMFCGGRNHTIPEYKGTGQIRYVHHVNDTPQSQSSFDDSYDNYDNSYSESSFSSDFYCSSSPPRKKSLLNNIFWYAVLLFVIYGLFGPTALKVVLILFGIGIIYMLRNVLKVAFSIFGAVIGAKLGGSIGGIVGFILVAYIISLIEGNDKWADENSESTRAPDGSNLAYLPGVLFKGIILGIILRILFG